MWIRTCAILRSCVMRRSDFEQPPRARSGCSNWLKRPPFVWEGLADDEGAELPGFDWIQPAEATAQAVSLIRTTVLAGKLALSEGAAFHR